MTDRPKRTRGEGRMSLSRRDLMKLVGAGLAVSSLPELAGCTPPQNPDDNARAASAEWFDIGRRDDLVKVRLGLVGLEVRDADKVRPPVELKLTGRLYLGRTKGPAYLMVELPAQHIMEEAWLEGATGTKPTPGQLAQHRLARRSQLSFFVPDAVLAIPYELEALLTTVSTLQLYVANNAYDEPGGDVVEAPSFGPSGSPVTTVGAGARMMNALRAGRTRSRSLTYATSNPEASADSATTPDARGTLEIPGQPSALVTQLELPTRLIVSPNRHATWEHSAAPVTSKAGRTELWHTRMGAAEGWMRTLRALNTRDKGFDPKDANATPAAAPFLTSLTPQNRADLVHVTTNFTLSDTSAQPLAKAVRVDRLMLSSLGAWFDVRGAWGLWTKGGALASWEHRATMGRDQKVQVAEYGYLYPYGHIAVKVTVTERKLQPGYEDTAFLWQRSFIVVKQPLRTYDGANSPLGRKFPFTSIRFKTLVSPDLGTKISVSSVMPESQWVTFGTEPFQFEVEGFDHDGNAHTFSTAAIFVHAREVADHFPPKGTADTDVAAAWKAGGSGDWRSINMRSQRVAMAPSQNLDDTAYTSKTMLHHHAPAPTAVGAPFVPQLEEATLALDAVKAIAGNEVSTAFSYLDHYVTNGFDAAGAAAAKNVAGVFMGLSNLADTSAQMLLSGQSGKSGGFVSPDLVVTGLSRVQGLVSGDPKALLDGAPTFDPSTVFSLIGAKLFGILSLGDLVAKVVGPDVVKQAPKFITQALDLAQLVFHTFQNASSLVDDLKARLLGDFKAVLKTLEMGLDPTATLTAVQQQLYARVQSKMKALGQTAMQFKAQAEALQLALEGVGTAVVALAGDVEKVGSIDDSTDLNALADSISTHVGKAREALAALGGALKGLALPIDEGLKNQLLKVYDTVVVKLLPNAAALDDFKVVVKGFVNAEEAIKNQHVRLDWNPTIAGWPSGNEIFWPNDVNGFRLGIDIRGKAGQGQPAGANIFASLTDFELRLIGKDPFLKLVFEKLVFTAGSDGKALVDVGFRGVHFGGPLSFIESIRQFIPLDGFSDPPGITVSPQGISANYTLALPNLAIGVFSLENLSLSAGFDIPFVGKSLTVTFKFCTREAPFSLTVAMLGGGGFVGVTLAPDGVRRLEIALEAQACLAIDFGVASGSVSAALGIYFAIESNNCKLSGYFRLRGCVQVLGIIHASIELYLELSYESSTGKVTGRASLEIEVSVFCFSASVTIESEAKFAGSNGDPTFRQVMAYDLPNSFAPWDDYCGAFTLVAP